VLEEREEIEKKVGPAAPEEQHQDRSIHLGVKKTFAEESPSQQEFSEQNPKHSESHVVGENIDRVLDIPLSQVTPDATQPRKYFDEASINDLADSIAKHGLLQPILVRRWNGVFQIVHGERRYRAHEKLGVATIKAIVRKLSDSEVEDVRLVENLERDNLSDVELAWEFDRRVKAGQTHEQIGKVIGKSRAFVTQRISLLKLPKKEQERMLKGELSFFNARLLLSIKDPNIRERVSEQIGEDTTSREALDLVKANVTRVTMMDCALNPELVDVETLAAYPLLTENKQVSTLELVKAYVTDMRKLRRDRDGE